MRGFLLFSFSATIVANSVNITYFVSEAKDSCIKDGVSLYAENNTAHGSLCAYIGAWDRIWACPAPDRFCWSTGTNGSSKVRFEPEEGHTICEAYNSTDGVRKWWQCLEGYETCSDTSEETNNCWSVKENPLHDVSSSVAQASASAYVAESATQSLLTTYSYSSTAYVHGRPTTAESHTVTPISTQMSIIIETLTADDKSKPSTISAGAVAGITVGAVVGGIAATVLLFWLWRCYFKGLVGKLSQEVHKSPESSQGQSSWESKSAEAGSSREEHSPNNKVDEMRMVGNGSQDVEQQGSVREGTSRLR